MSKKTVKYTDGEIGAFKISDDFLPPPNQLVKKDETVKVTLALSSDSVDFFKNQAEKLNVPYQRMIRALIDDYAAKHDSSRHN